MYIYSAAVVVFTFQIAMVTSHTKDLYTVTYHISQTILFYRYQHGAPQQENHSVNFLHCLFFDVTDTKCTDGV